jgi:hypothetical protein
MGRGAVSRADLLLLRQLAEAGHEVSEYQLESWRRHRMLPRPIRHGCGRGAGSTSQYPDAALPTALILADEATQGRSRHYGTMAVFAAASLRKGELFVDETAVRSAITWFLQRSERAVHRALESDPDDGLYRMADKIKAKTSAYDPAIIHLTNPTRAPTRRERDARARARKKLANSRWQRVFVMYGEVSEITAGEFADAFEGEAWFDDGLREEAERLEIEAGGYFMADEILGPLLGPGTFVEALKGLTFEQLCAGRDGFLFCCMANMMCLLNMALSPDAHGFWASWRDGDAGRFFGGLCLWNPEHPVHLAPGAVSSAIMPEYAQAMYDYATELSVRQLPYMLECMARSYVINDNTQSADLGMGLIASAARSAIGSDDPAWHRPALAEAIRELAEMIGRHLGVEEVDPHGIIKRVWGA